MEAAQNASCNDLDPHANADEECEPALKCIDTSCDDKEINENLDEDSSSWDDSDDQSTDLCEDALVDPVQEDAFIRLQYRPDILNIPDLPETVTILHDSNGGTLFLVGTAHFSKESCKDVKRIIEFVRPDRIVLELCHSRTQILHLNENYIQEVQQERPIDGMKKCIKRKGLVSGLVVYTMLYMSSYVTKQLGMAPGAEFRAAYQAMQHIPGCQLVLGDRPIEITLQRMLAALSFWQKLRFAFSLLCELKPITAEDVEKMKDKDIFEQFLNDIVVQFPHMAEVLVTERDIYLTNALQRALSMKVVLPNNEVHPPVVVGVVGIGHTKGIVKYFDCPIDQEVMSKIVSLPPPSKVPYVIKHVIRAGFACAIVYSVYKFVSWFRM